MAYICCSPEKESVPTDLEPFRRFSDPGVDDHGNSCYVIASIVRMKLISFRLRDKTHIIDMDSVGLITPEIEAGLPDALRERLNRCAPKNAARRLLFESVRERNRDIGICWCVRRHPALRASRPACSSMRGAPEDRAPKRSERPSGNNPTVAH